MDCKVDYLIKRLMDCLVERLMDYLKNYLNNYLNNRVMPCKVTGAGDAFGKGDCAARY